MAGRERRLARGIVPLTLTAFGCMFGCGAGGIHPVGAEPVSVQAMTRPRPDSPRGQLPLSLPTNTWSPPRLVAGDVRALREALQAHDEVVLRPGRQRMGPDATQELLDALENAAPDVAWRVGTSWRWEDVADARVAPVQREDSATPRPRYDAHGLVLEDSAAEGEGGVSLLVDEAVLDVGAWAALPPVSVGSCAPALQALAWGQEQSLVELEPFMAFADDLLRRMYRQMLGDALFATIRGDMELPEPPTQCSAQWQRWLDAHIACLDDAAGCARAPRLYAREHAFIGMSLPAFVGDRACSAWFARVARPALAEVGRRAAFAAGETLDVRWMLWVDRVSALGAVFAALEDLCVPQRRRYAEADLDRLRGALTTIIENLRAELPSKPSGTWAPPRSASWAAHDDVIELLRFHESPSGAANDARIRSESLLSLGIDRAQCRAPAGELPLIVMLAADGETRPRFLGYFFAEELQCGSLGMQ